jgi:hypothetical protein
MLPTGTGEAEDEKIRSCSFSGIDYDVYCLFSFFSKGKRGIAQFDPMEG